MITPDNYEGWLMRYADGELTAAERRQVEAFLAEHPDLAEELEAVASVRVTPVVATMPDKARLLRRAAVPVWRRVAAAATLFILAGTTLLVLFRPAAEPLQAEALPVHKPSATVPMADTAIAPVTPASPIAPSASPRVRPSSRPAPTAVAVAEPVPAAPQDLLADVEEVLAPAPELPTTDDTPLPASTVTVGYVINDARLAVNPWLEALSLNE